MMTTQAESEEFLVEELVAAEADAWNKGDAHAFSQMHGGHQLHEHNWDFLLWTRCL